MLQDNCKDSELDDLGGDGRDDDDSDGCDGKERELTEDGSMDDEHNGEPRLFKL